MEENFSAGIERTLVVFKPDAVQRGVVGEILTRFERVGLKIVGTKMIYPDRDHFYTHYEEIGKMVTRRGNKAFNVTLDFMTKGPVIAMVFEGVEAVEVVRKMVGGTEPKTSAPGTIRGDYSHTSFNYADQSGKAVPNLLHASGDVDEAEQEISHWFTDDELYVYQSTSEPYCM